jgi:hypothetical protein
VPPARCANCGASISGRYCNACGQRAEGSVHSLAFFLGEALEDLTHADSRLWRTLGSLIARPGRLTSEFLAGHRARYLPPVRLYLVLSVAFFLLMSLAPSIGVLVVTTDDHGRAVTVKGETLDKALVGLATTNETAEQRAERVCKSVNIAGLSKRYLSPQRIASACRSIVIDNGRALSAAVVHNLPRAMFLFLPLIALVMKLLYWHPPRYYVEHLLFLLHNQSCVFLLFGACILVRLLPLGAVRSVLFPAALLYAVWYLYRAMRRVYGQSPLRTAAKYLALSFTYAVSVCMMFGLTALYSLLTLGPRA